MGVPRGRVTLRSTRNQYGYTVPASTETAVSHNLKDKKVSAASEDAIKADFINVIFRSTGKDTYEKASPRALRTPFIEQWNRRSRVEVERKAVELGDMLMTGMKQGRDHEFGPLTGLPSGVVHEILPATEIINRMVKEARESLERAAAFLKQTQ